MSSDPVFAKNSAAAALVGLSADELYETLDDILSGKGDSPNRLEPELLRCEYPPIRLEDLLCGLEPLPDGDEDGDAAPMAAAPVAPAAADAPEISAMVTALANAVPDEMDSLPEDDDAPLLLTEEVQSTAPEPAAPVEDDTAEIIALVNALANAIPDEMDGLPEDDDAPLLLTDAFEDAQSATPAAEDAPEISAMVAALANAIPDEMDGLPEDDDAPLLLTEDVQSTAPEPATLVEDDTAEIIALVNALANAIPDEMDDEPEDDDAPLLLTDPFEDVQSATPAAADAPEISAMVAALANAVPDELEWTPEGDDEGPEISAMMDGLADDYLPYALAECDMQPEAEPDDEPLLLTDDFLADDFLADDLLAAEPEPIAQDGAEDDVLLLTDSFLAATPPTIPAATPRPAVKVSGEAARLTAIIDAIIAAASHDDGGDPTKGDASLPDRLDALAVLLSDPPPAQDFAALDALYSCWPKATLNNPSRALLAVAHNLTRNFGLAGKLPMSSSKAWRMLSPTLFEAELCQRLKDVGTVIAHWEKTQHSVLILEFGEIELIEHLFDSLPPGRHAELLAKVMTFKVLANRRMGLLRRIPTRLRRQITPLLPYRKIEALEIMAQTTALLHRIAAASSSNGPIIATADKMVEELEKMMHATKMGLPWDRMDG